MAAAASESKTSSVVGAIMSEFGLKDKAKDEDEQEPSPLLLIEKSTVIQECRVFHDAKFVKLHPKRCCQMITKLLYLLTQGETLAGTEASEVFFGVTKLFQSTDGNLRRMVYLFLKEVAESTDATEVIIVVQSLCKDMNNSVDIYRSNSIRTLAKIIDGSMLGQIDRYIKQAIVDSNDTVSSAALLCGLQLAPSAPDVIKRWVNEVQTALTTKTDMVQFHALALMRTIKQADKLAVSKLVTQLMRSPVRAPLASCLLIRYTAALMKEESDSGALKAGYDFLESCLRHKSEMVIYEASKAICEVPGLAAKDLAPAVTMLHMFLSSPKPTLRYVAVKTLSNIAVLHPLVVAKCNEDLETLVSDSNRTIATLAISTLLKTGNEAGIDRLMKQITSFMGEITDEFKVVVVKAIHELCMRYPAKYRVLLIFLSNSLREEGGFDFKKSVLDVMLDIVVKIPDATNEGLTLLCEFIEDCEFASLSVRVLHLLADKGPSMPNPGSFIRFVYNRIILETATIRAAAVTALAKFGVSVPSLRPSISTLLRRCLDDDDDEVRDRATLHLKNLEALTAAEGDGETPTAVPVPPAAALAASVAKSLCSGRLPMSVQSLTKSLHTYQLRPSPGPLTFDALPHVETAEAAPAGGFGFDACLAVTDTGSSSVVPSLPGTTSPSGGAGGDTAAAGGPSASSAAVDESSFASSLYKIPQFASLGPVFRSSKPQPLTESELEYLVEVVKHVFPGHVVLQFNVKNTVPEQVLLDVNIDVESPDPSLWEKVVNIPAPKVLASAPGVAYVAFKRNPDGGFPSTSFPCEMKFNVADCDPDSGEPDGEGYEDTFPLEPVEVGTSEFMAKVPVTNFRAAWEAMPVEGEVLESFALSFKTVPEAVTAVLDFLGMAPCDGTGVVKEGSNKHNAYLSGVFLGGVRVLARMAIVIEDATGCILKIAVRSEDPAVSRTVADCIH